MNLCVGFYTDVKSPINTNLTLYSLSHQLFFELLIWKLLANVIFMYQTKSILCVEKKLTFTNLILKDAFENHCITFWIMIIIFGSTLTTLTQMLRAILWGCSCEINSRYLNKWKTNTPEVLYFLVFLVLYVLYRPKPFGYSQLTNYLSN